eukprot:5932591-Prymnesium_polylepis.1
MSAVAVVPSRARPPKKDAGKKKDDGGKKKAAGTGGGKAKKKVRACSRPDQTTSWLGAHARNCSLCWSMALQTARGKGGRPDRPCTMPQCRRHGRGCVDRATWLRSGDPHRCLRAPGWPLSRAQKWSKGKVKEKLANLVLFDKATYDKMIADVPKQKLITPSIISEKLKVNGSLARKAVKELLSKNLI